MGSKSSRQGPYRLLLIEDDEDDVFLLERAIDCVRDNLKLDIEYEHVENGLEGLYLVSKDDLTDRLPDAVVLDLNMPRLGGVKFLKALRQSFLLKELPIFVLTTTTSSTIHEEAMRAGANKVYVKPDDADTLVAIAGEIVAATCCGDAADADSPEAG
jgi:two-component system, chemotaxis family, chemotaxis protein CheY